MKLLKKYTELAKAGYKKLFLIGVIRIIYLNFLKKKFRFNSWHVSPKEFRPYALDLIKDINSQTNENSIIVEIGCGIGEIVRNLNSKHIYGFDLCKNVIAGAKKLNKKNEVSFNVGSFHDIKGMSIDYLITVNFIHEINPKKIAKLYRVICSENDIKHIVVDFLGNGDYPFFHTEQIIPCGYKKIAESHIYKNQRRIVVFEKIY